MTQPNKNTKRNLSILYGQESLAVTAWTLASPAVVLIYLAVSFDVPVFLAGMLVTTRRAANFLTTLIAPQLLSKRVHRQRDLAMTDAIMAMCLVLALAAVALGTSLAVAIVFMLVMALIGMTEEFQSLINYDFMADVLPSEYRTRLIYTAMIVGGVATAAIALIAHQAFHDSQALTRHATFVVTAIGCFCLSALAIGFVRETGNSRSESEERSNSHDGKNAGSALHQFQQSVAELMKMKWFRRFLIVRLSLQTIELSIPFFAILAALAHAGSHRGLTALVISSAAALAISSVLWRAVSHYSRRLVMFTGACLAAFSGCLLVLNHFYGFANTIIVHSAALFLVTIAVQGIQTARYLYYMDIAPKHYRVQGLAVSKSIVRVTSIFLATGFAALAHTQHVTWAIAGLAVLNLLAAGVAFAFSAQDQQETVPSPQN